MNSQRKPEQDEDQLLLDSSRKEGAAEAGEPFHRGQGEMGHVKESLQEDNIWMELNIPEMVPQDSEYLSDDTVSDEQLEKFDDDDDNYGWAPYHFDDSDQDTSLGFPSYHSSDISSEEGDDDKYFEMRCAYPQEELDSRVNEKEPTPEPHPSTSHSEYSRNPLTLSASLSQSSFSNHKILYSGGEGSPPVFYEPSVTQISLSIPQQSSPTLASLRTRSKLWETAECDVDPLPCAIQDSGLDGSLEQSSILNEAWAKSCVKKLDFSSGFHVTGEDAGARISSDMDDEDEEEEEMAIPSTSKHVSSMSQSSGCGRHRRRNYTFTNEEAKRIERENERLLSGISNAVPSLRSGRGISQPAIRPNHSAIKRQRELERIHKENQAFLKRLESVKASPGMARSEQLADYERQAGYLGIPTKPKLPKHS